jgi:hypothetical protein
MLYDSYDSIARRGMTSCPPSPSCTPPSLPRSLPSQVSASHLDFNLTLLPRPGVKRLQILLGPLRKDTAAPSPPTAAPAAAGAQQQPQQQQQQQQATAPAPALTTPQQAFVPVLLGGRAQPGLSPSTLTSTGGLETVSEGVSEGGVSGSITLAAVAAAAAAAGGAGAGVDASAAAIDSFVGGGGGGLQGSGLGALGGFGGEGASPPGSPTVGQEVLPWIPHPAPHNTQAAEAAGPQPADSSSSPNLPTPPSAGPFSTAAAAPANDSIWPSTLPSSSPQDGTEPDSAAAAAIAAAAAAEAHLQEHWQAAALTYDWSTSQLQVLVGQPDALLKLLKQQADDLAAAEAAAAATAAAAAAGSGSAFAHQHHQQDPQQQEQQQQQLQGVVQSRTGTPTPEKLGYQTPALPPAPEGALADSIAAAQAAGLRVLACQLRGLDEGEPLQLRLLLDYSILELFCGTGVCTCVSAERVTCSVAL